MIPKKIAGKIYGAHLTADEEKALEIEVKKVSAEQARKHADEVDAILLWWLHEKLGFGYERLRAFHKDFATDFFDLCDRYEMETDDDRIWLCSQKLKDYDSRIDIRSWNDEAMAEAKRRKNER